MTQFTPDALPAPLADYFSASGHETKVRFFTDNAVVQDEGKTLSGKAAIADWLADVERRYRPRYDVTGAGVEGDKIIVTFVVSGTFPGSPATLRQAFRLENDQIRSLTTL